jgi:hypothetical protein
MNILKLRTFAFGVFLVDPHLDAIEAPAAAD